MQAITGDGAIPYCVSDSGVCAIGRSRLDVSGEKSSRFVPNSPRSRNERRSFGPMRESCLSPSR